VVQTTDFQPLSLPVGGLVADKQPTSFQLVVVELDDRARQLRAC